MRSIFRVARGCGVRSTHCLQSSLHGSPHCPRYSKNEGFWHVRASVVVSVSAARQRRCALAPYRPRVVVRRTAPRPMSTTHESLTVLCGCRLLLVAEGRVGALKECQNQEWPSDTFSEMPLPCVVKLRKCGCRGWLAFSSAFCGGDVRFKAAKLRYIGHPGSQKSNFFLASQGVSPH